MNRTGFRVLAISAAVVFCGAAQARIQAAGAAPAKRPGTPKLGRPGALSTAVTVDKIVTNTLAGVNQSDAKTAEIASRYAQVLSSRAINGLPEKRVDIDLVDVPLKDALKRVLDDSKTPYIIDDDVPNEPKVSIKLTNAPLTTILDALTISNKIGWRTELKRNPAPAEAPKPDEKANKQRKDGGDYFNPIVVGGTYTPQIHVGKTVTALPSSFQFRTMNIEGLPGTAARDILRGTTPPPTPQLRVYRWQNQKRTFTCPRCHNTISILQQPEEVRCTKCQRHFEDSWKVCPFDGTKRPEPKGKWRFCPICGKTITLETSWSVQSNPVDPFDFEVPTAREIEEVHSDIPHYLPGLVDEAEEHGHVHEPVLMESAIELNASAAVPPQELLLAQ
jgi:hypothetical protein